MKSGASPRGFGPWREANIVDHGNGLEWVIKLVSGDSKPRHLCRWHIEEANTQPVFQTSITSVLGKDSKVVIRGCAIGETRGSWTRSARSSAWCARCWHPTSSQEYDSRGGTAREGFFDFGFFDLCARDVAIPRVPLRGTVPGNPEYISFQAATNLSVSISST